MATRRSSESTRYGAVWYVLDGRHRYDHPQHGIYTGLAEKADDLDSFDGIV